MLLMSPNLDETAVQHSPTSDLTSSDLSFYVYNKSNLQSLPSLGCAKKTFLDIIQALDWNFQILVVVMFFILKTCL